MKVRKKPVTLDAEQFDDAFFLKYYATAHSTGIRFGSDGCEFETPYGTMRAKRGDWIITSSNGYRYVIRPDEFAAMYEPVSEEEPA